MLTTSLDEINKCKSGSFHVITGGSGMGKSVVMKYLTNKCAQDGTTIAHFCGLQFEQDTSFYLLSQMFHFFAPPSPRDQRTLVETLLDSISKDKRRQQDLLFPAMAYLLNLEWALDVESESPATVFHSSTKIPMIERSSAIKQVERELTKYFVDYVLGNVQVLMFDDCQFFDDHSFELLHHITREMIRARNVVVMFTRPSVGVPISNDAEGGFWWGLATSREELLLFDRGLVSDILAIEVAKHLAVRSINPKVAFHSGVNNFDDVLELIMRESKGNPFWVMHFVNIFKVAVEKGEHMQLVTSSFHNDDGAGNSKTFGTLNRAILMAFDTFSAVHQELLKTAAVIGTVFEIRILKKVLPVTFRRRHNFEMQVKLLIQNGIIQSHDHDKKNWVCEFAHDLSRRGIASLVPPSKLSMLHKQVAESYEYFYQDDLRPLFARLAYHYDKSGMSKESFVYLRLAASTELQLDSVNQGMEMVERGIAIINNTSDSDRTSKLQMVEQLEMVLLSCLKDAGFADEFLAASQETYDTSIPKGPLHHFIHRKYNGPLVALRTLQAWVVIYRKPSLDVATPIFTPIQTKKAWKLSSRVMPSPME